MQPSNLIPGIQTDDQISINESPSMSWRATAKMPSGPKKRRAAKKKETHENFNSNNANITASTAVVSSVPLADSTKEEGSKEIDTTVTDECCELISKDNEDDRKSYPSSVSVLVDSSEDMKPNDDDQSPLNLTENEIGITETVSMEQVGNFVAEKPEESSEFSVEEDYTKVYQIENGCGSAIELEEFKNNVIEQLKATEKMREFLQKLLDHLNSSA
ncbi:hypothetical protein Adt_09553 [Abeliophyllum distichum]|uniref:Uncharacterized protein n=1 Tax=Abeliophyllum distichum TaxID=126358 RepID=A0ABD1UHH9_9LAMI